MKKQVQRYKTCTPTSFPVLATRMQETPKDFNRRKAKPRTDRPGECSGEKLPHCGHENTGLCPRRDTIAFGSAETSIHPLTWYTLDSTVFPIMQQPSKTPSFVTTWFKPWRSWVSFVVGSFSRFQSSCSCKCQGTSTTGIKAAAR
jgi:hypothetical protein